MMVITTDPRLHSVYKEREDYCGRISVLRGISTRKYTQGRLKYDGGSCYTVVQHD